MFSVFIFLISMLSLNGESSVSSCWWACDTCIVLISAPATSTDFISNRVVGIPSDVIPEAAVRFCTLMMESLEEDGVIPEEMNPVIIGVEETEPFESTRQISTGPVADVVGSLSVLTTDNDGDDKTANFVFGLVFMVLVGFVAVI